MSYLDTRALEDELEELAARRDDEDQADPLDEDETARLVALEALRDEVGDEWRYGVTLIPEDDFEDYARELAEDIGAVSSDASWPARCIDWEQAADELRVDYSSTSFDGTDYLYR